MKFYCSKIRRKRRIMIGIVNLLRQYTGAGVVKGFNNLVAGKPTSISFLFLSNLLSME